MVIAPPDVLDGFHRAYYDSGVWTRTYWRGVPTQKCPLDLWIYQEILFELRPNLIIETGTADGGSAFFLASVCDLIGHGQVITVDIEKRRRPQHRRVSYIEGRSSADPAVVRDVKRRIGRDDGVMVILDSDHSRDHVLTELHSYAPLVTEGQYIIVEDTNVNGHPVLMDHGPGPMEAVDEFLRETDAFEVDGYREKFGLTFNPRGYLRRREGSRVTREELARGVIYQVLNRLLPPNTKRRERVRSIRQRLVRGGPT